MVNFPFNPIVTCCRGFKQDCPDGQLGKDKILEMYSMILPAGNAKETALLQPKTYNQILFDMDPELYFILKDPKQKLYDKCIEKTEHTEKKKFD